MIEPTDCGLEGGAYVARWIFHHEIDEHGYTRVWHVCVSRDVRFFSLSPDHEWNIKHTEMADIASNAIQTTTFYALHDWLAEYPDTPAWVLNNLKEIL